MTPQRPWLLFGVGTLIFLSLCAVGTASGAEGAESSPVEAPIGIVFRWLNFILVLGGLGYLMAKKGPAFFRQRAEAISASIAVSSAAKAEADRQLRRAEARLAGLEQEIAQLRAEAGKESAAEAERIRSLMREEAAKIERAGRSEIAAAERAARMELKGIAAQLAVERAEALIRQRITAETQASLFSGFLQNLSRSAN